MGKAPALDYRQARVALMATTIPALMGVGPLVGWFLGQWIGGMFSHADMGGLIGLVLGLVAGGRESYLMTRRIIRDIKKWTPER
jgi:hypothetical protein